MCQKLYEGILNQLQQLNEKLTKAANLLDECAVEMKASELQPSEEYVYKIGELLAGIFEIQHDIYAIKPSLTPKHLKESEDKSLGNLALNHAYKKAMNFEDNGEIELAILVFQELATSNHSKDVIEIAKLEIKRLKNTNT